MRYFEEQTGLPLHEWVSPLQRTLGLAITAAGLMIGITSLI